MENGNENTIQLDTVGQLKAKLPGSSDEKAPDSSDNGASKTRQVLSKGKKRKKPKDSTAPRHPLTGM